MDVANLGLGGKILVVVISLITLPVLGAVMILLLFDVVCRIIAALGIDLSKWD